MKTIKNTLLAAIILAGTSAFAQEYTADANESTLKWTGKKVSGKHWGMIDVKEGKFTVKDNKIASGEFVIDMTTITVDDLDGEWRDKLVGHLNSDDFFSTDKYKTATIKITESEKFENGVATVKGNLTIKGKTHPVTFDVKKDGNSYSTTVTVDRTLYDIRYGSGKFFENLGDNMIDDNFTLEVNIKTI
ncbi:MAG TPA: YceI family protein [Bacteroidales bacterium]|jgi:polyisoprenoid-binding protein YceI|nr:YceI family protein [Bacteroidales bacterium]